MKKQGNLLIKVALGVGFAVTLYSIINQQFEQNKLNKQLETMTKEVDHYADSVDELAYDLSICDKPEYFEKAARRLGYYRYGDTVFINDRKK